jgi:hypothetical protein
MQQQPMQQQPPYQQPMQQQPPYQQPMQQPSPYPQQQQPYPPQQQQPLLPMQPPIQSPPSGQGNYPVFGAQAQLPPRGAPPTGQDMMDRPVMSQRPSMQNVAGFGPKPQKKAALQPWMLVVGALIMAALAFAVTRAFIAG